MANFVRAERVVGDAVNFCADSDVIEVSIHARGPIQWVKKPFETPIENHLRSPILEKLQKWDMSQNQIRTYSWF